MAIIATLKPVELRHGTPATSIVLIPLNKLVPWDGNVRKTNPLEKIDELAANIEAHGVLQSLVVKKASRGKFSVIAGRRRHAALSQLAEQDKIAPDHPVPCCVRSGGDDAAEISLAENVVRVPMHPADQYVAFSELVEAGSTPADIAARFGISETAVKQRLKLGRVSPRILEVYRGGELTLEQVQAFTITDDHAAQERVLDAIPDWHDNPDATDIRNALTENEVAATDKRARFVTIEAYEVAGGAVQRDLFTEGEDGVFLLDSQLLDRLALEKLKSEAETVKAEGWKWVDTALDVDRSEMDFRVRRPEPVALSEAEEAEHKQLSEEYDELFDQSDEPNEETSERLEAIESRIAELQTREKAYTPEAKAIAGALLTIRHDGTLEVMRGLVRPEDLPEGEEVQTSSSKPKERPEFSSALVESLTAARSAAIGVALSENPAVALVSVAHSLAMSVFGSSRREKCVAVSGTVRRYKEESQGAVELTATHAHWGDHLPGDEMALWDWCLAQDQDTLLKLLALCAGCTVDAVQTKHDRSDKRLALSNALASALNLDMTQWFTPTAENYFSRVGRDSIVKAICEAKSVPAKRSWQKQKKSELAALAEREVAGTNWLPEPIRA